MPKGRNTKMGFLNGKWSTVGKNQKQRKNDGNWNRSSWNSNAAQEDWACVKCDPWQRNMPDHYQGNYASEDHCRDCGGHNRNHHHMKMVDRAAKIAAGEYKSRDEARQARVDREAKKSNWNDHWSSKGAWASSWGGGWGTTPVGDNSIGNEEIAELFL